MLNRPFLTVPELAQQTGESEAVWRKRVANRLIPFVKCGRNVRIRLADFEEFCRERTVPAIKQTAAR